jgi:hypothetical protein
MVTGCYGFVGLALLWTYIAIVPPKINNNMAAMGQCPVGSVDEAIKHGMLAPNIAVARYFIPTSYQSRMECYLPRAL